MKSSPIGFRNTFPKCRCGMRRDPIVIGVFMSEKTIESLGALLTSHPWIVLIRELNNPPAAMAKCQCVSDQQWRPCQLLFHFSREKETGCFVSSLLSDIAFFLSLFFYTPREKVRPYGKVQIFTNIYLIFAVLMRNRKSSVFWRNIRKRCLVFWGTI